MKRAGSSFARHVVRHQGGRERAHEGGRESAHEGGRESAHEAVRGEVQWRGSDSHYAPEKALSLEPVEIWATFLSILWYHFCGPARPSCPRR